MTIDAFLERDAFDELFEREVALLGAFPVDVDAPWLGLQLARRQRRRFLISAELVIVVVSGDLFPRVGLFLFGRQAEWALFHAFKPAPVRPDASGRQQPL